MFSRPLTSTLLTAGPAISVVALVLASKTAWLPVSMLPTATAVALMAWSPFFISIPALLLQDARDAALDSWRGPVGSVLRGLVLIPYLMASPHSPIRLEILLSLIGLVVAGLIAVVLVF